MNSRVAVLDVIVARSWVFIADGVDEGSSDHHFIPAFAETESLFAGGTEISFEMVRVRRRRMRRFLGKVVFVAIAKGSAAVRHSVLELIIFIAPESGQLYNMVLRFRKRGCLGNE